MKKSRHGDYQKILSYPVFQGYYVHVVFTDNLKKSAASRFVKGTEFSAKMDAAEAIHLPSSHGRSLVLLPYKASPGTIAHEAYHAIRYMLKEYAGVKLDNEIVAYHLGHLVDEIHKFKSKLEAQL